MRTRRHLGGPVATAAALAIAIALAVLPTSAASAAPGALTAERHASAATQAHRAAVRLARVQRELDQALQSYDDALTGLDQQVADGIQADDAVAAATQVTHDAQAQRTERVRAIYMDGGQLGLYASFLGAGSPQDLALRIVTAQHIVAAADADVVSASTAQTQAEDHQVTVGAQTQQAVLFADDVTARADRVATLVRAGRAAYQHLSARARHAAAAEAARAAIEGAAARADRTAAGAAGRASAEPIPAEYLTLYRSAAQTCSGLSWTLLAAVGQVESGHGRNNGPSSAGAIGPMQFRPRTFDAYAVDGDRDGRTSAWDPADAIFTAAHFLCLGGAGSPSGVQRALLRYNAAQWYVDLVLSVQQKIAEAY